MRADVSDRRVAVKIKRLAAKFFLPFFLLFGIAVSATAQNLSDQAALDGRYFLVVWSFQGPDDDLVHAHTFVSFYEGKDLASGVVHPMTISWLPATGIVKPFGAEKGHNYSLDDTLSMACHAGRRVKSWGPYEIKPELFVSATRRLQLLKSGQVQYSMINNLPHSMNCITAAGDITEKRLDTGILWGVAASSAVVKHLSPYFVGDGQAPKDLIRIAKVRACPGKAAQMSSEVGRRSIADSVAAGLGDPK
jgi:hypothetical protein